jgi:diguanylate cyclase (GGDEF)-like protein
MAAEPAIKTRLSSRGDPAFQRVDRRVGTVEALLLVLTLVHFFTRREGIEFPFFYFLSVGIFGCMILLFRFTRLLPKNPRFRLNVDCVSMVAFITIVLALSGGDRWLQNLYLLPIIASALILGRRATAVMILLVVLCRVALDLFDGQAAASLTYTLGLLMELAPAVLAAFLITALAGEFSSAQQRLRKLSDHDHLTGLLNMKAFTRLLHDEQSRARQVDGHYTVLMIDVDGLKKLNDLFGREQGDRVLQAVADALKRSTRADDLIARYGGDEFAVCLADADQATAQAVGNRIRHNVYRTTLDFAQEIRRLTVSIGAGTYPDDAADVGDVLVCADRAMYEDKQLRQAAPTNDSRDSRSQALGDEF